MPNALVSCDTDTKQAVWVVDKGPNNRLRQSEATLGDGEMPTASERAAADTSAMAVQSAQNSVHNSIISEPP